MLSAANGSKCRLVEAAQGRLHREGVPLGRGRHAAVYLCVV